MQSELATKHTKYTKRMHCDRPKSGRSKFAPVQLMAGELSQRTGASDHSNHGWTRMDTNPSFAHSCPSVVNYRSLAQVFAELRPLISAPSALNFTSWVSQMDRSIPLHLFLSASISGFLNCRNSDYDVVLSGTVVTKRACGCDSPEALMASTGVLKTGSLSASRLSASPWNHSFTVAGWP